MIKNFMHSLMIRYSIYFNKNKERSVVNFTAKTFKANRLSLKRKSKQLYNKNL